MDPIEEARTKIKGYLDDVITLGALVKIAHGEGDLVSAAHYRDLMRKTLADGGTFCASLVGVTPEGEPEVEQQPTPVLLMAFEDEAEANQLVDALSASGITAWVAPAQNAPGFGVLCNAQVPAPE